MGAELSARALHASCLEGNQQYRDVYAGSISGDNFDIASHSSKFAAASPVNSPKRTLAVP